LVVFWVSEGACRVRSWGLGFAGWRLRLEAGGCRLRLETGSLKGKGFSSMAGFWMHQVLVPGHPSGDRVVRFLGTP
jgi:hypothetical protein